MIDPVQAQETRVMVRRIAQQLQNGSVAKVNTLLYQYRRSKWI